MNGHAFATTADLPKLVGYQQLKRDYGWPKRTVQEWIKKRKFPQPLNMPGRGNYWALDDIVSWIKGDLSRAAVSRPEDLTPEQLEEATLDLAVRVVENRIGRPANPAGVHIGYGAPPMPIPEGEFNDALAREAAMLRDRFADFDVTRSCVVAAWLFPHLRELMAQGAADEGVASVFREEDRLLPLALSALSEHSWENGLAALKSQSSTAAK